ncbi:hypothetical protein KUCAC02_034007, partial [Chaenocephalus aceratus]
GRVHRCNPPVQERLQAAGSDQMNNRPEQRESITLNARQLKGVHGLRFREDSVPQNKLDSIFGRSEPLSIHRVWIVKIEVFAEYLRLKDKLLHKASPDTG